MALENQCLTLTMAKSSCMFNQYRDPEAYPVPCIYTQIETEDEDQSKLNPEPHEEDEEEHNWIFSADQMEGEEASILSRDIYLDGDHDLARTVLECIEKNRNSLVMMGTFCFQSLHRSAD
ncbi:hypothetical protein L6164_023567 [Bauhinia variegata]|uniref:Uncharacterized protein n=1 Tax=Bauhinia variegata TaxID=167791 RepID=A0ACB9MJH8_BAUVA|nr:hypothetical protein L6164_023567 [Bauhinia variegata]